MQVHESWNWFCKIGYVLIGLSIDNLSVFKKELFKLLIMYVHLVRPNDWLAKLDLKDAYLTVPVHPSYQKYLRCIWKGEYYQCLSMPFGLSSAPRTFTKLLRPVVAHLRSKGVRMIIYLDVMLILHEKKGGLKSDIRSSNGTYSVIGLCFFKLGKVGHHTDKEIRISGSDCKFRVNVVIPVRNMNSKFHKIV